MNVVPPKGTLGEIAKNPMAYVLFIMGGLLIGFVTWAITTTDKSVASNNHQLEACIETNKVKDSIISAERERFTNYLLRNDSTNRALLDKPARDLLKTIEKGK